MFNIVFDADREITSGIERDGQQCGIVFRGAGGMILSFFVL